MRIQSVSSYNYQCNSSCISIKKTSKPNPSFGAFIDVYIARKGGKAISRFIENLGDSSAVINHKFLIGKLMQRTSKGENYMSDVFTTLSEIPAREEPTNWSYRKMNKGFPSFGLMRKFAVDFFKPHKVTDMDAKVQLLGSMVDNGEYVNRNFYNGFVSLPDAKISDKIALIRKMLYDKNAYNQLDAFDKEYRPTVILELVSSFSNTNIKRFSKDLPALQQLRNTYDEAYMKCDMGEFYEINPKTGLLEMSLSDNSHSIKIYDDNSYIALWHHPDKISSHYCDEEELYPMRCNSAW